MSDSHDPNTNLDEPVVYHIRLKGHLGDQWNDWFGSVAITPEENGETLLTCVVDQAALYGLLRKVRDLGMLLIAVNRVDPDQVNDSGVDL
jgi:hypothetical protein